MAHKKSAKKEEFTIRENNNEPDANIKRRETLLLSPIEQSALQIFQFLYQSLPIRPLGLLGRGCPVLTMAARRDEGMIKTL